MTRDRRRADEADGADDGMVDERVDCLPTPVDQVDDAGREPRLLEQPDKLYRRHRHLLGGLEEDGAPARDHIGEEPEGDHRGEVERRDDADHAERLTDHRLVDPARNVLGGVAPIPFVEGQKDRVRRHIGRDSESRYSNWAAFHFANSFDERYWV